MRIAVDAMGGDNAPDEIVRGALLYRASSREDRSPGCRVDPAGNAVVREIDVVRLITEDREGR